MTVRDRLARIVRSDIVAAAFIFAAILNISYFPFLWGGKTLLSSASDVPSVYSNGAAAEKPDRGPITVLDAGAPGWQTEPFFAQIHHQLFVEKRLPLWNPTVGYGEPLAADMLSQPFFPLSIIQIVNPSPSAYNWLCVTRFFVAALGAFCFLRLFTSFWPAIVAGLSLMFAGYYLIYYDIPHLSVETLLPWLFYVNERLVRSPRFSHVLAASFVDVLVYLGGMPESQLLVLSFAYLYALYRVATDRALRASLVRILGALGIEAVAGLGGAAFLLVPFIEYLKLSQDQHQAANIGGLIVGLGHDTFLIQALTYAVPLIWGPPWGNVTTNLSGGAGIRGFFGISAVYLGLVATFGAFGDRLERRYRSTGVVAFFAVSAVVLLGKRFGCPVFNWIGLLPGFSLVGFAKYEEALLAFAMAILAGCGVARIAEEKSSAVIRWWASVGALGLLTITFMVVRTMVTPQMAGRGYTIYSLLFAIAVLAAIVVVGAACGVVPPRRRSAAILGLVAVVGFESIFDYFIPMHYFMNRPASAALDPYRGAPYVSFLQGATRTTHERIVGQDALLYPDWSGAFDLDDVRDLDAMYDKRYLPLVRTFLNADGTDFELRDRFTVAPRLDSAEQQRFLSLSSVGFVATNQSLDPNESVFAQAFAQNIATVPPDKKPALAARRYTIAGVEHQGLLEHPPFSQLPLRMTIPHGAKQLGFAIGMDPAVYAPGLPICGAGAAFTLEVRDGAGHITQLFHRYIDPKHIVEQRHWIAQRVNVSRWAGKTVDFLLSTAAGPAGDVCADWAVWGGGQFLPTAAQRWNPTPFTLAYSDRGALVYRFDHPLPRISIFENVKTAATSDEALTVLSNPAFDIFRTVVVTPEGADEATQLAGLNGGPAAVRAGVIVAYDSQDVRAHVTAARRSVVVLNDTDYPGWNAYVDGKPVPVLRANALFRGVIVEPGAHDVEFKYEPASYRIGAAITGFTVVAGIVGAFLSRRRRRDLVLAEAA